MKNMRLRPPTPALLCTADLVVDEELGSHHNESEHVHEADERVEHPAVPPPVLLVQQRVSGVADHERAHQVQQVRRRDVVELLRLALVSQVVPCRAGASSVVG